MLKKIEMMLAMFSKLIYLRVNMKDLRNAFLKGFREAWSDYWQPLQWLITKLMPNRQNEKLTTTSTQIVWTVPKILTLIGLVIILGALLLTLGILLVAIGIQLIS